MKTVSNQELISAKVFDLKQDQKYGIGQEFDQSVASITRDADKIKKIETSFETITKQNNRAILESSLHVSVGTGNEPMALLFKTAIEGINEVLATNGLGTNAIQETYGSGLDVSPAATADRIVSMSTAFFSQFQQQHTELTIEDAANSFMEIISGGIDKGFEEAKKILDGLNVLQGNLVSNIDLTYSLVQKGLKVFADDYVIEENESQNKN